MPNPRADYSPIFDRPALHHPEHARVLVWPVINVEVWDPEAPMPRTVLPAPQGREVLPDVANFGWFDYGVRVGFWRLKRVLDSHGIRATLSLNAVACDEYPQLVGAAVEANWELLAHGYIQRVINVEPDERATIRKTLDRIEQFSGTRPRGWMGPGLAETFDTPDILAEEGVEYVCDWCNDDQPYAMKVRSGELISVPYTVELNDIAIYAVQHHRSSEILDRTKAQFDTLYEEGAESPRVMAVSTHPYLTGAAHRISYFDQIFDYLRSFEGTVFVTAGEVLDWYRDATSAQRSQDGVATPGGGSG
ncbi:MAG: polysaccharide deacetylase family protein [Solirubrobacteraceae bacterium]